MVSGSHDAREPGLMSLALKKPRCVSIAYEASSLEQCRSWLYGCMSAMSSTTPRASRKATDRGIGVSFIHMQTICGRSKTKSMPWFGGSSLRPMSPRRCCERVIATSTVRTFPSIWIGMTIGSSIRLCCDRNERVTTAIKAKETSIANRFMMHQNEVRFDRWLLDMQLGLKEGTQGQRVRISGILNKVFWRDDDTGLSVLSVRAGGRNHIVKGYTYAGLHQRLHIEGEVVWNAKYKHEQIEASSIVATDPITENGAILYLSSGVVKGIGKVTAERIVRHFGVEVFRILDENPDRIAEVPGIPPGRAAKLAQSWRSRKAINEIVLFLNSQGISPAYARRIYKTYGKDAISIITQNPYRLCDDVRGIGFVQADRIATNLGIPHTSTQRIRAGIIHTLSEIEKSGSTGQPLDRFLDTAIGILGVDRQSVLSVLEQMLSEPKRRVVEYDGVIYSAWLAACEEAIGRFMEEACASPLPEIEDFDALLDRAQQKAGIVLTDMQKLAVRTAAHYRVMILTGGPGCGKTSTLSAILSVFQEMGIEVAIAAPTGKAAQRAREVTGIEAMTLHRLLKIGSETDEPAAITSGALIIDEASMIDVPLMYHVVRAIKGDDTRLVLVGDADQLPSVGPGSVLRDLILSGIVPVVRLDRVFRQAQGSLIITNAHAVRKGNPIVRGDSASDFWVIDETNYAPLRDAVHAPADANRSATIAKIVAQTVLKLVTERIPSRRGLSPKDIWVLSPMNGGDCGVRAMNEMLREAINPNPEKSVSIYGQKFGIGDRVIQCRNNYKLGIFNGDTGYILDIDEEEQEMLVSFDGNRQVVLSYDDLDDLKLAYAMTVHKAQGSQMPAVVIPIVSQHYTLLQRQVLYTALTRAKQLAVLVGEGRMMKIAIRNMRSTNRITRLWQIYANGFFAHDASSFDVGKI